MAKSLGFEIIDSSKSELGNQRRYNPEFVKEILEAEQSIKDWKGIKMTMEELKNSWKWFKN